MKSKFFKLLLIMISVLLYSVLIGATVSNSKEDVTHPAELFGEYNFDSQDPITVVIELKEPSLVEARHTGRVQSRSNLDLNRNIVIEDVLGKVDANVYREYDYVFSGFSVELPESQVLELLAVEGIKAIYPDVHYTKEQVGEAVRVSLDDLYTEMIYTTSFIGAQSAWSQGYTGKGVVVAILDDGVDYTHPDLVHAFDDYKGYDFVENTFDPYPGLDEFGYLDYHGTHVAGTVAANGLLKGVAPEATLLAYRVLGPSGGTTADVVAGIEMAVQDGVNIMNLSLGNTLNSADWATSIALDWAMAEGVVAVTSNGNSGPNNWTVGSPGASRKAISVGATQLPHVAYGVTISTAGVNNYSTSKVGGTPNVIAFNALSGNTYEFVHVGLGYLENYQGVDVEGKVALVSRGDFAFTEKVDNAKANGAVAVILYNNAPGEIGPIVDVSLPTVLLSGTEGQQMLAELTNGNNEVIFIFYSYLLPETVAEFSSRGPVASTWMIKPDVVAPGVQIISTASDINEEYFYMMISGTSMSSPHVAGAAALILQANPDWNVDQVKAALMNTAKTLIDPTTNQQYPHNTQGAGSIRVDRALATNTLVLPGSHSFGTFLKNNGRQVERQSFEIQNLTNQRKHYTFEVVFDGNPDGIRVMTSNNLRVNANSTQQVNFNVQVDASKLTPGYYPGTIFVSDGIETFEVPTILFVGEPDYVRITHGGIVSIGDEYILWSFLPGGVDLYEVWIYSDTPFAYKGDALQITNLVPGYYEFIWDGSLIDGRSLESGVYHAFIYAEKAGVGQYIYAGPFIVG